MIVVHVSVVVKDDCIEAFTEATKQNAAASLGEPGVARFDVIQSIEEPSKFVLVEVYKTEDAPAAHKDTAHYQLWRDTVADMMAVPRSSVKYTDVYPEPARWQTPSA
jgi:quinol monooxygenase YgiN